MNKEYIINELTKEASYRIVKTITKALKQGLFGNKVKDVPIGDLLGERLAAKHLYDDVLTKHFKPFRARIAAPNGLADKLSREKNGVITDLLGIQVLKRKNIAPALEEIKSKVKMLGGTVDGVAVKNKPGYKGINVKTTIKGVPTEIQLSPGYRVNIGQILQHDAYKSPEGFTKFDKKIADTLGKFLIKSGTKNKKDWNDFFERYKE